MKTRISKAAFIFILVFLSGCAREMEEPEGENVKGIEEFTQNIDNELANDFVKDDMETVKADGESTENNVETSETDEEREEDEWNVDFEVIRAEYIYDEQRNEIEIYYPQLCGFEDSEKEERINILIEEDVKKVIGEKNKGDEDTFYRVVLDYEIKFSNERIISILYKGGRGYIMPGRARMYVIAVATTIDIEEEKVFSLQDVVIDFTELSDMLLADEFEGITMWEGVKGEYPFSGEFSGTVDELEENLREKPQEWYTDGENFIFISMEGQYYNEYSIRNESVEHILDAEFLKKLEEKSDMLLSGEEFGKITECLDEQVPEIWNEWADYIEEQSGGEAHLMERMEYVPDDVYRDYEETEYLGKYYLVYVGEIWEDHSAIWEYFYVSEDFSEVLWYDIVAGKDSEYPVLYLDEWRNSDFYPKLDKY